MNLDETKAALQAAFNRCETVSCPLTEFQKQLIVQVFEELTHQDTGQNTTHQEPDTTNPLDELTPEQRRSLLQFVKELEGQSRPWKIQLLNDWLEERDSGPVQFIRDFYGPQWLNRVKLVHFAKYEDLEGEEALKLKVGDRIEVSNGLWEWVQEAGPCSRQWFLCTVVSVNRTGNGQSANNNCIIRFSSGAEYEIQGVYQWNRYNWRWPQE